MLGKERTQASARNSLLDSKGWLSSLQKRSGGGGREWTTWFVGRACRANSCLKENMLPASRKKSIERS